MKKTNRRMSGPVGIGLVAVMLCANDARATILVRDTFEYPNGNLVGNNGGFSLDAGNQWTAPWTNASGSAASDFQVVTGHVETPGNIAAASYHHRYFTENQGLSTYYFGFDLYLPVGTENDKFLAGVGLAPQSTVAPSSSTIDGWIYARRADPGSNVFLGTLIGGSSINASTTPLLENTLYRVVGRIAYGTGTNDTITVWLNPINEASTPEVTRTAAIDVGSTLGANRLFLYRELVNSSSIHLGDVRVATDFMGALPEPNAAMLMLLGFAGMFARRRSR